MGNYSDEITGIINKLQTQGKMCFAPKATDVLVRAFEVRNGVNLPTKYKEWLLFSDGGECFLPAGVQLYGVAHKPIIDVNDKDKPNANYIIIGALASGDPILCEKSGERISIYNLEAGKIEKDEIFIDFFSFLNKLSETLGIGG